MKKKMLENDNASEDEFEADEPSEVEELQNDASDDDWTPAAEPTGGRRVSGRARAPVKRSLQDVGSSSEEEEGSDNEGAKAKKNKKGAGGRARGGGAARGGRGGRGGGGGGGKGRAKAAPASKKAKQGGDDDDEEEEEEEENETSSESDSNDTPAEFRSGSFVLLKTDFKTGGDHPIWKIDGKSLLQKYVEHKDDDGETVYKSTTIYAGWSKSSKESYYPISVVSKKVKGQNQLVTFERDQIKEEEAN